MDTGQCPNALERYEAVRDMRTIVTYRCGKGVYNEMSWKLVASEVGSLGNAQVINAPVPYPGDSALVADHHLGTGGNNKYVRTTKEGGSKRWGSAWSDPRPGMSTSLREGMSKEKDEKRKRNSQN
jgi:hypothetical protein